MEEPRRKPKVFEETPNVEMIEGLSNTMNPNDSFDRIFNKELDLEIGKIFNL